MQGISLAIVGVDFPNKRGPSRAFDLALCKPGEPVELVLEPKNPADPNAVMIVSARGVQLGYVTAERAPLIRGYIVAGRAIKSVFQNHSATGGWIRLAFDGLDPVVDLDPPQVARVARLTKPRESESGFWPDEVYPDE